MNPRHNSPLARALHSRCMVCGDHATQGMGVVFESRPDGAVCARVCASSRYEGYGGIAHGGFVATLLDAAMAHCLMERGVAALTGDMRVRYKRPAPIGSELEFCARAVSARPPVYDMQAEARMGGALIARATGRFFEPPSALADEADRGNASAT